MIRISIPLPRKVTIACSGGVDSMAVVDFLRRNHDVTIAHFHHKTSHAEKASAFVAEYCADNKIPMIFGVCRSEKGIGESSEEYWRRERYDFLSELGPVITCHHLDDCVETYVWSCMHGNPKVIPAIRNNVLRPFLTTRKREFENWCAVHHVPYIVDESNQDIKYTRNYIRQVMMPHVLRVNPGIHTLVKKIIKNKK